LEITEGKNSFSFGVKKVPGTPDFFLTKPFVINPQLDTMKGEYKKFSTEA